MIEWSSKKYISSLEVTDGKEICPFTFNSFDEFFELMEKQRGKYTLNFLKACEVRVWTTDKLIFTSTEHLIRMYKLRKL